LPWLYPNRCLVYNKRQKANICSVVAMERSILLVDMNAFYASVHQAVDPGLKGKPVIVGGDPAKRHGIVLAASYEAKALGIKTGMAVRDARALCPQGIFVTPRQHLYIQFSTDVFCGTSAPWSNRSRSTKLFLT